MMNNFGQRFHEKDNWATTDGEPNILIDDFIINTNPWRQAGGIAILHTSVADTIAQLQELQNEEMETDSDRE